MDDFQNLAVIILAAGKGTRMKSDKAKVLHQVAGKSMVCHVVECALKLAPGQVHVVIGHQAEVVKSEIDHSYDVRYAVQTRLLGTGDAVKAAVPDLSKHIGSVLVLCGDVPLIREDSLKNLIHQHMQSMAGVTVLATELPDPTGYGRILLNESGQVAAIREEADATDQEKKIKQVNTGIYCFKKSLLVQALEELTPDNNQNEYYLTDVIAIAKKYGEPVGVATLADSTQVIGVNTLTDLERAERLIASNGR